MELVAAQLQEAVCSMQRGCRGDTERMHVEVTHFINNTVTAYQLFDLLKLQTNNGKKSYTKQHIKDKLS